MTDQPNISYSRKDLVREREMLRYRPNAANNIDRLKRASTGILVPHTSDLLATSALSTPDHVLLAFAQLCCLKLNASNCLISVIGKQYIHTIAEATRNLVLADPSRSVGSEPLLNCDDVDKKGRLCEYTLEAVETRHKYAVFSVEDLAEDPRFNNFGFVKEPPCFKAYAGTPLRTESGVNIGSLYILDTKVRDPLDNEQVDFLGTMAKSIMTHLGAEAEAREKSKLQKLSFGINAFVEGRSRLGTESWHNSVARSWTRITGTTNESVRRASLKDAISRQTTFHTAYSTPGLPAPLSRARTLSRSRTAKKSLALQSGSICYQEADTVNPDLTEPTALRRAETIGLSLVDEMSQDFENEEPRDSSHQSTLARACNIIYEALELKGCGGVMFYDSATRRRHSSGAVGQINPSSNLGTSPKPKTFQSQILCSKTVGPGLLHAPHMVEQPSYIALDDEMVHSLLRRYPKGKLWNLGQDTLVSSDEDLAPDEVEEGEEESSATTDAQGDGNPYGRKFEKAILRRKFPNVKQLLFYGLWDAGSSRWFASCFAWTVTTLPTFTPEIDLNYLTIFGNSVMAQVSRLASMEADRQKADFIGTISHELRSPLHGILASAEFLSETVEDAFQESLIDTISSCGRTLLDTVNHILDYSKIASFERNSRPGNAPARTKTGLKRTKTSINKDITAGLSLFAVVDVASLVEEVVEGVAAGQIYQDISSTDAARFSNSSRAKAHERGIKFNPEAGRKAMTKDIEVVIEVFHGDYKFVTQPGAIKRVVMNIFGNALKYTQKGTIHVRLSLDDIKNVPYAQLSKVDTGNDRILRITVMDTGKGISRGYLRTNLYNAFSQEDVLASGTGLGLSIVRSIVTMLQGAIDIQSEVGSGTDVSVWLPLATASEEVSFANGEGGETFRAEDSIEILKTVFRNKKVALCGFDRSKSRLAQAMEHYIKGWFLMRVVTDPAAADVMLFDENGLASFAATQRTHVPVIVLGASAGGRHLANSDFARFVSVFVSKRCGVHKLAKALRLSLEKARSGNFGPQTPQSAGSQAIDVLSPGEVPMMQIMNHVLVEDEDGGVAVEYEVGENMASRLPSRVATSLGGLEEGAPRALSRSATTTKAYAARFPFPNQLMTRATLGDRIMASAKRYDNLFNQDVVNETEGMPIVTLTEAGPVVEPDRSPTPVQHCRLHTDPPAPEALPKKDPSLLLVDDNKVNLRLLETYMKRRKYKGIDLAEDGQLAVDAAMAKEGSYDVVFMDISMPVMNGFEAIRAIRDLEQQRRDDCSSEHCHHNTSLIIALTGLTSGKDQAEAFASGTDLFLTKPVSFKEVGKLLDRWEERGGYVA